MSRKKELSKLSKGMLGSKMTKEELKFQDYLRAKLRAKELTVKECHKIWGEKYGEE